LNNGCRNPLQGLFSILTKENIVLFPPTLGRSQSLTGVIFHSDDKHHTYCQNIYHLSQSLTGVIFHSDNFLVVILESLQDLSRNPLQGLFSILTRLGTFSYYVEKHKVAIPYRGYFPFWLHQVQMPASPTPKSQSLTGVIFHSDLPLRVFLPNILQCRNPLQGLFSILTTTLIINRWKREESQSLTGVIFHSDISGWNIRNNRYGKVAIPYRGYFPFWPCCWIYSCVGGREKSQSLTGVIFHSDFYATDGMSVAKRFRRNPLQGLFSILTNSSFKDFAWCY